MSDSLTKYEVHEFRGIVNLSLTSAVADKQTKYEIQRKTDAGFAIVRAAQPERESAMRDMELMVHGLSGLTTFTG